jgi:hypothetical protein
MTNPPPEGARGFSDCVAFAATVAGLALGTGGESNNPSRILFVFWFPDLDTDLCGSESGVLARILPLVSLASLGADEGKSESRMPSRILLFVSSLIFRRPRPFCAVDTLAADTAAEGGTLRGAGSKVVNAVGRVRDRSVKSTPCRRECVSSSAASAASIEKSANIESSSEPKVYSDSSVPLRSRVNAGTAGGLGFEGPAEVLDVTVVELFEAGALGMMEDVDGIGLGCASVGLGAGGCGCCRGAGGGAIGGCALCVLLLLGLAAAPSANSFRLCKSLGSIFGGTGIFIFIISFVYSLS